MKIAINTRFLLAGKLEGIGIYTFEIFKRVVALMPEHEFYFLFDRPFSKEFIFSDNITPIIVAPPARHPFLWYWWYEQAVPRALKRINADIFISPDGFCSLKTIIPQLLTIHDLGFEHYPHHTPFWVRNFYRKFSPKYCEKAWKIMAVSAFTQQDIVNRYGIEPNKIEVVYNGFDLPLTPIPKHLATHHPPYFIFVGAVHPRKNILGLLKAFEAFKQQHSLPHQLVIVGRKAWMLDAVEAFFATMQYKNEVIWKEHAERDNLISLLQDATALVYPSWFEGFGIPLVEAMALGVPVIASSAAAIPEIVGDAAIIINPDNALAFATAMFDIVHKEELRTQLIEKGKLRAQYFKWDKSAKKVVTLLRNFEKAL